MAIGLDIYYYYAHYYTDNVMTQHFYGISVTEATVSTCVTV